MSNDINTYIPCGYSIECIKTLGDALSLCLYINYNNKCSSDIIRYYNYILEFNIDKTPRQIFEESERYQKLLPLAELYERMSVLLKCLNTEYKFESYSRIIAKLELHHFDKDPIKNLYAMIDWIYNATKDDKYSDMNEEATFLDLDKWYREYVLRAFSHFKLDYFTSLYSLIKYKKITRYNMKYEKNVPKCLERVLHKIEMLSATSSLEEFEKNLIEIKKIIETEKDLEEQLFMIQLLIDSRVNLHNKDYNVPLECFEKYIL